MTTLTTELYLGNISDIEIHVMKVETHTIGIPGRGPIIGGIGGGTMCIPAIGMGGTGAEMCGEGVTLFCMSLGIVE